jgi:hypothetical protein
MLSVAHYEFDMDDAQNVTPNRLKYRLTHEEYDMISEDFNDDFRWLGYTPISL